MLAQNLQLVLKWIERQPKLKWKSMPLQAYPSWDIVGLPDTAVKESKERVKSAIKKFWL